MRSILSKSIILVFAALIIILVIFKVIHPNEQDQKNSENHVDENSTESLINTTDSTEADNTAEPDEPIDPVTAESDPALETDKENVADDNIKIENSDDLEIIIDEDMGSGGF